jgi:hypothetical protein
MTRLGITGILIFAVGGMLLTLLLDAIAHLDADFLNVPLPILSFIGFVLIGLGLWLIIRDGKP